MKEEAIMRKKINDEEMKKYCINNISKAGWSGGRCDEGSVMIRW